MTRTAATTLDKLAVPQPLLRDLGRREYLPVWRAMQAFTEARNTDNPDEIWCLEHPPVFTLGRNAKREHVLAPNDIPVIQTDRGGQVTYHGPGQLVIYLLLDLHRLGLGIRSLVRALERSIIDCLSGYDIQAEVRPSAPGVYVAQAKIGSLGLRVRKGCSYHGLALNVNMDLEPFTRINPCGFQGLRMTQISALGGPADLGQIRADLLPLLCEYLALADPLPFETAELLQ